MKYRITLDEQQLQLVCSAVQLQMRVRKGQGWAITQNVVGFGQKDYVDAREYIDPVLDAALKRIAMPCYELRKKNAQTAGVEYDIWKGLRCAKYKEQTYCPMSAKGQPHIEQYDDTPLQR